MQTIPPEILTCIFCHICQSARRTTRTGFLITNPAEHRKALITLTHVCRYWRATILSSPQFWTTADLSHQFMTPALLERSGSLPIIATYMTPNTDAAVPSTEALLPHFSRIQKFHIDVNSLEQLMEFLSNLRGHSPILEAVELRCSFADERDIDDDDDDDDDSTEMWKEDFELPAMLRDATTLKFFRASTLPFSDCFLELHHLTHLELSSCATAWACDYRSVMAANPMLEVVILRDTAIDWEERISMDGSETTPINLPHLRRLELHEVLVEQILRDFVLPPGTHLTCTSISRSVIPRSDDLLNASTVEKLQFRFLSRVTRTVFGSGPNGTFLLTIYLHGLNLDISDVTLGLVKQLSISFADTGTGEADPSLTFVNIPGHLLESNFSSFSRLQALILQRVRGCEGILRRLCDPHIFPRLNTVVLVSVQSHTTYWPSLVELARVRGHHPGPSNILRVDIGCRAEEPPEPDQLAELRAYVCSVEVKPWNHEVEELDWLNDSRFTNFNRL